MSANTQSVLCPALFLAATSSGEGKTTITAAIARFFSRQGLDVRVFKTGPDYLDPMILAKACGQPVEQLDTWMAGEEACREQLFNAAQNADLILIEGVMGIYDGTPSSADLAELFDIPIALVINARAMAQTAAAIACGIQNFRPKLKFAGLITNSVSSARHQELISDALAGKMHYLAALPKNEQVSLPERHLGLVQAHEYQDLDQRLDAASEWISSTQLAQLPEPVEFFACTNDQADNPNNLPAIKQALADVRIGIARDDAFSFIYAANIRTLEMMGAKLKFFSPLNDQTLPEVDALWLPGGYPELHHQKLSDNKNMLQAIRQFQQSGKNILAECGGMMYCMQTLTDLDQQSSPMLGLLQGHASMRGKSGCQGMQTAMLPEGEIRAHAHHRSLADGTAQPIAYGKRQKHSANGEPIYRKQALTASYLHLYFASNPKASAGLFKSQS